MSRTLFDKKMIYDALTNKLNVTFKSTRELTGWYYLDGKKTIRFRIPHGRGAISIGFQKQIERTSRLDNQDFDNLINCPMKGSDYDKKLRDLRNQNLL